jgi:ABC-type Fe3+-hydroxamate transport system substrate-binding protein
LQQHFRVWISDVATLEEALEMIGQIGALTGTAERAQALISDIRTAFRALQTGNAKPLRAAYFIWRKPYMVAAEGTFIHEMLGLAGFENVFAGRQRYPEIDLDTLAAAVPEVILLSSEPYPFAEKHFAAFREACPDAAIYRVDGEMFSWYGSRLLHAPAYFMDLKKRITMD